MKTLFDKVEPGNHQSFFDVFIAPYLGQNQTANLKKLGYTFNDHWGKTFIIPSNESGNGWYELVGFINGAFIFEYSKISGGLFQSPDRKTSRFESYNVFHRMTWTQMHGGSRVYNGNMIHKWIKQIDEKCVKKFNNSKSENNKVFYLGLILLSSILEHYYDTCGGYQYNYRSCDNTFNLLDEGWRNHPCMKNTLLDFEQWKESGITYRERDYKKDGYSLMGYSGAQFALLKKRLQELKLPEDITVEYILAEFRKQIKGDAMLYLYDMNTKYTTEYFEKELSVENV